MPSGGDVDRPDGDAARDVHERARAQFGPAGDAYTHSPIHAAGEDLARLVEVSARGLGRASAEDAPLAGVRALDVATGAGHTALALARAGARVVASDLTPEMLTATERTFARADPGLAVQTRRARAEALPFDDGSFELVTCRIAAHHFADPAGFVLEVARVLRPGGVFVLIDNVASEDPRLAEAMNHVERVRDSSHVEGYTVATWIGWARAGGLDAFALERWMRTKDVPSWLARSRTPVDRAEAVHAFVADAPAEVQAYLGAVWREGRLVELQHESALLGFLRI